MSRFDRFSSSYHVLKGPEEVQNFPECLQEKFRPTKDVRQEIQEHQLSLPSKFQDHDQAKIALAKFKEEDGLAYRSINESLMHGNHKQWENTIYAMNVGIRSNPVPAKQRTVLYRGIDAHAPKLEVGSTVVLKGFNSCSRSKEIAAHKFAGSQGTVFQINNWRVGTEMEQYRPRGLSDEQEVLLPPYIKLRVTNMRNYGDGGQTIEVDVL
jgi:hypothetical protein